MSSFFQLHIWQLSEKTVVASVHVMVSRDVDYMNVADSIRKVLHEFGVHSSTIQPEFGAEDDSVSNVSVSQDDFGIR
jgi:zinc transporter 1